MTEPEVLIARDGGVGRLSLNRPRALGALTLGMCEAMTEALLSWRGDPSVRAVLIDHAGERGFCAGGDIRALAESGAGDGAAARAFFHTEYRLDHLLSVYGKTIVAVMDGTVMGGGVGISSPAPYRLATERTRFAMPETGIGLFPDVGGGWFLPRMPGRTGLWVALTGARLGPADCLRLGVATHVVESARLPDLKSELAAAPESAAQILARFAIDPGPAAVDARREDIDRLFAADSVEAILDALAADGGEWAAGELRTLAAKAPMSMKVTHRLVGGRRAPASLADDLVEEYRLASRIVRTHDFLEGVRAVIVDKDNAPAWRPKTLAQVGPEMIDALFAPLPPGEEWTPLPEAL